MSTAIKIENVSKLYRLGTVGTGTLAHDLNRWWHSIRGKEDPYARVGQINDRTQSTTKHNAQSTRSNEASDYVWALRDVNLEAQKGEILGIIGRNGAGKSTLLKLLSRVTAPTSGAIKTKGRIASLLEVGTGFHPELTGRENIYVNGAILGMRRSEITRRLDEIVEFSGCARYLDTPVKRYSSGMTVRLGFAVAAHLDCEILIVDEVLAVGDTEFQRKCLNKMQDVSNRSNRTVLFVSHNLSSVQSLCSKAVVLETGAIAFCGDVHEAISFYGGAVQASANVNIENVEKYGERHFTRLMAMRIYNQQGELCTTFRMGDTVTFVLIVECHRKLDNAEIGVKISSRTCQPIHYLCSRWEGIDLSLKPGLYEFTVTVPNLSLLPGKYIIGAWSLQVGWSSDDNAPEVTSIEVIEGSVFGRSADFSRYAIGGSEVFATSSWETKLVSS